MKTYRIRNWWEHHTGSASTFQELEENWEEIVDGEEALVIRGQRELEVFKRQYNHVFGDGHLMDFVDTEDSILESH